MAPRIGLFSRYGIDVRKLLEERARNESLRTRSAAGLANAQALETATRAGLAPVESVADRTYKDRLAGAQEAQAARADRTYTPDDFSSFLDNLDFFRLRP